MRKKSITKTAAAIITVATMIVGMVMPAWAAVPTATISVSNVETGATVTAYQIVKGTYTSDDKLSSFVVAKTGITIADLKNPTPTEITAIANDSTLLGTLTKKDMKDDGVTPDTTADDGTYAATAEPGLYLVIAQKANGDRVYNPALVAVNVTDVNANTVSGGTVDLTSAFTYDNAGVSTVAYIKSTTMGLDKKVGTTIWDSTKKPGDTVSFTLDNMTIPSYSSDYDYTSIVYKITDQLETGKFEAPSNIVVKVGGTTVAASATTFTQTITGTKFEIVFNKDYLKGLAAKTDTERAVVVTYDSKLTTDCGYNFDENTNHASVEYSNDPTNSSSTKTKDKNTYSYTFGIDGIIDGGTTNTKIETTDVIKVTNDNGTFSSTTSTTVTGATTTTSSAKLPGAIFTLYSDEATTTQYNSMTATSDANGHISFLRLPAGTYYMKETTAPTGYTLNPTIYKVEFKDVTTTAEGALTGYTQEISTKAAGETSFTVKQTNTYSMLGGATPTVNSTGNISYDNGTNSIVTQTTLTPVQIIDTNVPTLPSTGGAGTVGFIIAAVVLAGGFIVFSKATKEKK